MSLTFDCGASGEPTPAILDALSQAGVRTTFFLTGQWVTRYPELSRRIGAEHEVANHTWSHSDLLLMSETQIRDEMERGEAAIRAATGVSTKPLWRAPFGSRNARLLSQVQSLGWGYHIFWSADSGDWTNISPQEVRNKVNAAASNGAIIVQHCGSTQSAQIIGPLIADLKAKGFALVPVSALLRD